MLYDDERGKLGFVNKIMVYGRQATGLGWVATVMKGEQESMG